MSTKKAKSKKKKPTSKKSKIKRATKKVGKKGAKIKKAAKKLASKVAKIRSLPLQELKTEDSVASEIMHRIREVLTPTSFSLKNLHEAHKKHKEAKKSGGGHYILDMVSEAFSGLNLQQRQQWINNLLSDLFGKKIHALKMNLREPSEVPLKVEEPGSIMPKGLQKKV